MDDRWIVICHADRGDEDKATAAHGWFSDQHRALVWANQHDLDFAAGRRDKCPTRAARIWTEVVKLEPLA